MKILFLNSIGSATWGGGEKWMLAAAEGLRRRGHQVCVSGREGSAFLARCGERGFTALPLAIRGDFNFWVAARLRRFLAAQGIDAVVANFNRDVRLTALARWGRRRPLIIARNGLAILPNNWRYRLTYRRMVAGIVTNTEAIRRRYLTYGWLPEDFVRVIPNGIDPQAHSGKPTAAGSPGGAAGLLKQGALGGAARDSADLRARHGIPSGRPVVGIIGRLVRQKRHDLFLEVGRRLVSTHPDVLLLVVGEGPEQAAVERRAAELGLTSSLRLAGFQRDVFPLLECCDVVTLTSEDEGLPNAVMEAMLAARPIVAFDVGGVAELLGADAGAIVPFGDVEAMADRGRQLLDDPLQAGDLGRRARERVLREFSIDAMVARFETYLEDLLRARAESPS